MDSAIVRKEVRVVGVTFENDDGVNRQEIIENLAYEYDRDLYFSSIELCEYLYNGEPAYHVTVDGSVIGNLASDFSLELKTLQEKQGYMFWVEDGRIVGGEEDSHGEKLNYGVRLTVCIVSPEAKDEILKRTKQKAKNKKQSATNLNQYSPAVRAKKLKRKPKQRKIWKLIVGGLFCLNGLKAFGISTLVMDINIIIGGLFIIWWIWKDFSTEQA